VFVVSNSHPQELDGNKWQRIYCEEGTLGQWKTCARLNEHIMNRIVTF